MVRYPDELVLTWQKDGSYVSGHYVAGDETTETIKGRAEPNGKGQLITTEDGAQIVYDFTFYCDLQAFTAPFGAAANLNTGQWTGTVKRQANHQTGTQIWL